MRTLAKSFSTFLMRMRNSVLVAQWVVSKLPKSQQPNMTEAKTIAEKEEKLWENSSNCSPEANAQS
jgi:hypothetical protein